MYSASGPDIGSVTPARDQFRTDLGGGTTPGAAGSFGGIRREINWDGVPASFSAPNNLPANFFNANSPRGAVFSTAGTGFQVSANAGDAPIDFGNIEPTYTSLFATFSPQRLFTSLGSNIIDVNFFLPGTNTPALSRGFGAVFTDVDLPATTKIEYYGQSNNLLFWYFVPNATGNESFSFLGVSFPAPVVARVRITAGNAALETGVVENLPATDLVVMDDFIYGEPAILRTWYRDFDNDGFGDPARSTTAFLQPAGYVANNTDCNDYRTFYQDMDNDGWGSSIKIPCGLITRTGDCDDNNARVHSPQTFYRDADGDSWGDAGNTTVVCSSVPPAGYVANRMDCNDNDANIRFCATTVITKSGSPAAESERAAAFVLSASPNPVQKLARIQYSVPVEAEVNIKIYDVMGREVNALFSGRRSAGNYTQEYNTSKLSQGVYYCRLVATANGNSVIQTQKLVKTE